MQANDASAVLAMVGATGFTVIALAKIKHVGPLLLLSRVVDRMRAFFACVYLSGVAFIDEYRRMYPACLAKVQRER